MGESILEKKRVYVEKGVVKDLGLELPGIFSITAIDDKYDANKAFVAVDKSGKIIWQITSWWIPGSSTLSASSSGSLCIKHYATTFIHVKRIG